MIVPSSSIGFNLNHLDRRSDKRDDEAFVANLRNDSAARFLVFDGDVPLLKRGERYDAWFVASEALAFGQALQSVFLGEDGDGSGHFALGFAPGLVQGDGKDEQQPRKQPYERIDLRSIAMQGLVPHEVLGVLGEAKSMLDWHNRHRFCANCGARSRPTAAGWQRLCDACGARHFPRVDPVVIMLTIDGERCLLGRQRQFAPGMYSALAGFVEPGETVEDAVRREVHEEAHVNCAGVVYFASQPWPFPSSLMIGCFAQASDTDIVIDTTELEDARWFTRAEVAAMLEGTHADGLSAPKPFAIAHHLLRAYVEHGAAVLRG
ncbi:NAD(+) diphosphatase [Paraburkholderia phymatum]|uniref:NAD(+) diphosphatase n=1 Tax=Paraburkholderia phymatum (strain DSM 17167 / CIP 108236 / LMG 21445 / STM815) TaxID=391038 RepID=B2JMQ8_PARP8|nr:NAD(+) diphosphatase [Paraburkholderia phymatum]ACC72852.1 NUDIX hydrolase [Paraburkholderia phymatum STM815]